jgi:hypothetical protein
MCIKLKGGSKIKKSNIFNYMLLALVLPMLIVLNSCGKPAPTPPASTTPTPTPAPSMAEFEVIALDFQPSEVIAGETVTITAEVKNSGGSEGTYNAILTIDGATVETKEVVLTPGTSRTVTFSLEGREKI